MAFHDVQLPDDVERGALGGPRFKTFIVALPNGKEKRRVLWEKQRGEWDIGYGIQVKEDATNPGEGLDAIVTFFYARMGMANTFRFKDWADFEMPVQNIGTGDAAETAFQIFKRYTSGGINYDRNITLPYTTLVYLNGVLQLSGYTLGTTTGIVTFSSPPGGGVAITVSCEFDVPVRFNTDALDINMQTFEAGIVPSIPIIEDKI
jgi:uncharacterized protein (TIGR02217 family)